MTPFRVLIFADAEPHRIKQLLRHLIEDLPEVELSLLYEEKRRPSPMSHGTGPTPEGHTSLGLLIQSVVGEWARSLSSIASGCLDRLLRWLHAAPFDADAGHSSVDEVREYAEHQGVTFCLAADPSSQSARDFVRNENPDLGVIFGDPTQDSDLFRIPRKGSIALHSNGRFGDHRAGPATRDSGRSNQSSHVVSAYRLAGCAGSPVLLDERSFPVQQYDTSQSIAVKSDLLGIECLVNVIRSERSGDRGGHAEGTAESRCDSLRCHGVAGADGFVVRNRRPFRPRSGRPLAKLMARFLLYPKVWMDNRRRAVTRRFPIVILFGHVVADRPKFMGVSTDQFLRQVRFLKKHYRIASLPDAIQMLEEGRVPSPTVVLTFDDGYGDNYLGLRAVIDSEDIPVTLFVSTRNIEENSPFDHDLRRGESDFFPLTWDQLKAFEHRGSTIGSHTRTHFDCGSRDEALLKDEIAGAQDDLRHHLGHTVPYFSFPWGYSKNMSKTAIRIAAETYPHLFAAYGGANEPGAPSLPFFRRACLPETLLELELLLQGLLDFGKAEAEESSMSGLTRVTPRVCHAG